MAHKRWIPWKEDGKWKVRGAYIVMTFGTEKEAIDAVLRGKPKTKMDNEKIKGE